MVHGLNYPRGPLGWADAIGLDHVLSVLLALLEERREERYRPAPALTRLVWSGGSGARPAPASLNTTTRRRVSKGAPGDRRRSAGALLRRIALDFSPLRASRDFRLIEAGQVVSGIGSQIALVALPTQIFLLSHSAALVGLLGLFELGPMVVASLLGGAVVDRVDRRNVLIAAQFIAIAAAGALAAVTLATHPPAIVILILGGLLAGSSALDNVTRAAIVPESCPPTGCARRSPSTTAPTS